MSTRRNASPSLEGWKGEFRFDGQVVSQATECGMCAESRKEEAREGGKVVNRLIEKQLKTVKANRKRW